MSQIIDIDCWLSLHAAPNARPLTEADLEADNAETPSTMPALPPCRPRRDDHTPVRPRYQRFGRVGVDEP